MAITIGTNGWATAAQVKKRFAHLSALLGDANSPLQDADIERFITDRFREINAILDNQGITLTELDADTVAEDVLLRINGIGAAMDVARSMMALVGEGGQAMLDHYTEEYNRELERLSENFYNLGSTEGTQDDANMFPSTFLSGGTYDSNDNRWKTDTDW